MVKVFDDNELAIMAKEGDSSALADLLIRYEPYVRSRAFHYKSTGFETEDLIQEGMIGLLSAVRNYVKGCGTTFKTFVSICVDRRMISALKSITRQKRLPDGLRISLDNEDTNLNLPIMNRNDPEEIVIIQENLRQVKEKIEHCLSKYERDVLTLYLAGYPYKQMGIILGKKEKSIDNAMQRIKTKLTHGLAS